MRLQKDVQSDVLALDLSSGDLPSYVFQYVLQTNPLRVQPGTPECVNFLSSNIFLFLAYNMYALDVVLDMR